MSAAINLALAKADKQLKQKLEANKAQFKIDAVAFNVTVWKELVELKAHINLLKPATEWCHTCKDDTPSKENTDCAMCGLKRPSQLPKGNA